MASSYADGALGWPQGQVLLAQIGAGALTIGEGDTLRRSQIMREKGIRIPLPLGGSVCVQECTVE